jgi:putative hydrolase of the HAD superfamily
VDESDLEEAAVVLGGTRSAWLWRHPIPSSVSALAILHERGVPIGVVSNASGQIESVLRRMAVCQVGNGAGTPVRCVIDSHVVGVAKPDPRIFAPALAALGLAAEHVAYVGDSVTIDIAAARSAGLHPVLLDPYGDHTGAPHARIETLHDVLRWW